MPQSLNINAIRIAMRNAGLNASTLARHVNVSREAVSQWFKGTKFPRPDKLLKMGMTLGLQYNYIVNTVPELHEPVIAFRKKGARKTKPEHIEKAKRIGSLLRRLAEYVPYDQLINPPTLQEPVLEYGYIQKVVLQIRSELEVDSQEPIEYQQFIKEFNKLHAIIIPVLWGQKEQHENALHIYLPDSRTTWIYLNIDSSPHDFNFWMAHELGHVYAPQLVGDEAENFADAFAEALLFPENAAKDLYMVVSKCRAESSIIKHIVSTAGKYAVAPYTVYHALQKYAEHHNLPVVTIENNIHAITANIKEQSPKRISDLLFGYEDPTPGNYVSMTKELFQSDFFDILRTYNKKSSIPSAYLHEVLDMPLTDAKELQRELC